jgi:hypothetical protein
MNTVYYHVTDPLENFSIRVRVRELSRAVEGDTGESYEEDVNISWQEKVDGPVDVIKNHQKNTEMQTNGNLSNNLEKELKRAMLYTYVDKDHYWTDKLPSLFDRSVEESYMGAAMSSYNTEEDDGNPDKLRATAKARETKLFHRINKDKPFQTMYLCLGTDIDIAALKDLKDKQTEKGLLLGLMTENILCKITLYNDGLLEMTPDFSGAINESLGSLSGLGASTEKSPLSVFLNDDVVKEGVREGFRVNSHRIRSKTGVEYEFCLENVNEILIPSQLAEIKKRETALDKKASQLNRASIEKGAWKQVD